MVGSVRQHIVLGTDRVDGERAMFRIDTVSPYDGTVGAVAFDDDLCLPHAAVATVTVARQTVCTDVVIGARDPDTANGGGGPVGEVPVKRGDPISIEVRLVDRANGETCVTLGGTSVRLYVTPDDQPAEPVVLGAGRIGEGQDACRMELVAPADGLVTMRPTDLELCPSHTVIATLQTDGYQGERDLRSLDTPSLGHQVQAGDRIMVTARLEDLHNLIMCVRFGWIGFEVVLLAPPVP